MKMNNKLKLKMNNFECFPACGGKVINLKCNKCGLIFSKKKEKFGGYSYSPDEKNPINKRVYLLMNEYAFYDEFKRNGKDYKEFKLNKFTKYLGKCFVIRARLFEYQGLPIMVQSSRYKQSDFVVCDVFQFKDDKPLLEIMKQKRRQGFTENGSIVRYDSMKEDWYNGPEAFCYKKVPRGAKRIISGVWKKSKL